MGADGRCRIEKGAGPSGLKLGPGCLNVYPALARAKSWQERSDGSLALTASDGAPVVVFAVSDGLAFESIEPANPLITLSSSD